MVKNKALPDSSRLSASPSGHSLSLFLSLSLTDLALSRLVSCIFSLSPADAVHPEGTPWILTSLDPGKWRPNRDLKVIPKRKRWLRLSLSGSILSTHDHSSSKEKNAFEELIQVLKKNMMVEIPPKRNIAPIHLCQDTCKMIILKHDGHIIPMPVNIFPSF